jgi:hypothetical protein
MGVIVGVKVAVLTGVNVGVRVAVGGTGVLVRVEVGAGADPIVPPPKLSRTALPALRLNSPMYPLLA